MSSLRILLIDIDNKYREKRRRGIPVHKARGDQVGFDIENPDITHISCVFTRNQYYARLEAEKVSGGLTLGGPGCDTAAKLPEEIELLKPDYDLYPHWFMDRRGQTSIGFTSRGCPRECPWCIVPRKEGKFRRVQHVRDFHDARFPAMMLLDNNILADRDWFFENTDWLIEHKVKLNISQGMDIRLLTDEIAEQLHRIRFIDGQMRFAWDRVETEERVKAGIEMLKDHGINVRRNVAFYVLCGFFEPGGQDRETFCKDVYRCNQLRGWNVRAYVMPYEGGTPLIRALARWANRPPAYWKIPFYQYDRMPKAEAV